MRSVVAGRLINVYSENDYILAFLYRTSAIQYGVAGLQEAQDVKGIENVNVSELVSGHLRYQYLVGSILEKIGFEDIDIEEVAKEEETLALLEEEEKKEQAKKSGDKVDPEDEAAQMEKEVKTKTEQTLMERAAEKLHLGK
jgi:Xaa-Pro aminopeptidase